MKNGNVSKTHLMDSAMQEQPYREEASKRATMLALGAGCVLLLLLHNFERRGGGGRSHHSIVASGHLHRAAAAPCASVQLVRLYR